MARIALSRNFWLDEFTRSETAARLGRPIAVEPGGVIHLNLERLCREVLQPLRESLGAAMFISSGYRPDWLNERIGGAPHSQHGKGLAADVVAAGFRPYELCERVIALGLPYDQLIHEFGEWTHVSIAPDGAPPRADLFTVRKRAGNSTEYVSGLWRMDDLDAVA